MEVILGLPQPGVPSMDLLEDDPPQAWGLFFTELIPILVAFLGGIVTGLLF